MTNVQSRKSPDDQASENVSSVPWPAEFEKTLRAYLPLLDKEQPITPDLVLADYGMDSLATVNLLLDLEEEYAVSIPDERLTSIMSADAAGMWAALQQEGANR